ncbi:MAG: I78 family peptidase inhibitor [Pseudomonadota bacterium]
MRIWVSLMVAILALAGCKSETSSDATDSSDLCGASGFQSLVGEPFSEDAFSGDWRVVRPGLAVTQEYIAERLNVEVDENDVIVRIGCG